jgi:hypothetical protein
MQHILLLFLLLPPIQNSVWNYESVGQSVWLLGWGSARRKAATYTQENTNTDTEQTETHINASNEIRAHDPNVWTPEDISCLRSRGHGEGETVSVNRSWRPIGLWDVEAPTFSRQSAHRWRWGCHFYASAALHPQEDSWYSFVLEAESNPGS